MNLGKHKKKRGRRRSYTITSSRSHRFHSFVRGMRHQTGVLLRPRTQQEGKRSTQSPVVQWVCAGGNLPFIFSGQLICDLVAFMAVGRRHRRSSSLRYHGGAKKRRLSGVHQQHPQEQYRRFPASNASDHDNGPGVEIDRQICCVSFSSALCGVLRGWGRRWWLRGRHLSSGVWRLRSQRIRWRW